MVAIRHKQLPKIERAGVRYVGTPARVEIAAAVISVKRLIQ
jgi:hypothetical protein